MKWDVRRQIKIKTRGSRTRCMSSEGREEERRGEKS
jgi:hypothetical protein